jgi:S1-C subfamily serine protease
MHNHRNVVLSASAWWLVAVGLAAKSTPVRAQEPTGSDLALALESAFIKAIERGEPSIVSVVRIRREEPANELDTRLRPDPFVIPGRRIDASWFDINNPNYVPNDFGSGVVVDARGLILTNYHVVERAREIYVVLHNGQVHPARLWSTDPRSDLAVLRVEVRGLSPMPMGDGGRVKKGQIVLALGNPMAVARDGRASASWGIVSNLARRLPPVQTDLNGNVDEIRTLHHSGTLLQTDARLYLGTSGGALLNLRGEMIGLTTAWAAIRGYDQAAGYAIPIDDVTHRLLAVLMDGREVEYGFLAIAPRDLNAQDSRIAGFAQSLAGVEGVVVDDCFPGGPAAQAGLAPLDVITHVEGEAVRSAEDLILKVGTRLAGSRVQLRVIRNGSVKLIQAVLGKYPMVQGEVRAANARAPWRGVHVDYITMVLRDPRSLRDQTTAYGRLREFAAGGVLIMRVETGSPGEAAGLKPDTIVTHVGATRVRNPDEFRKAAENSKGKVELTTEHGKVTVGEGS